MGLLSKGQIGPFTCTSLKTHSLNNSAEAGTCVSSSIFVASAGCLVSKKGWSAQMDVKWSRCNDWGSQWRIHSRTQWGSPKGPPCACVSWVGHRNMPPWECGANVFPNLLGNDTSLVCSIDSLIKIIINFQNLICTYQLVPFFYWITTSCTCSYTAPCPSLWCYPP